MFLNPAAHKTAGFFPLFLVTFAEPIGGCLDISPPARYDKFGYFCYIFYCILMNEKRITV